MSILESSLVEKCNLVHAIETTTIKRLDYLLEQRPTLKCNNIVFFETFLRR
jgi:predicted metal-binding protein